MSRTDTEKSPGRASRLVDTFALAWRDTLGGLDRVLDAPARAGRGVWALLAVFAGLALGWWLYVPVHELLHALGCLATGGSVTRLEIDPLYGGALLATVFPFVVSGSDYAGQLTGFDTGGSAFVYMATVVAPFVLTLFPGVWLLRKVVAGTMVQDAAVESSQASAPSLRAGSAGVVGRPLAFGASLPFALAPFLSLPGDAFEAGGILVTRWLRPVPGLPSDDAILWFGAGFEASSDLLLGLVALFLGLIGCFAVYALADRWARVLGQSPLAPLSPSLPSPTRAEASPQR